MNDDKKPRPLFTAEDFQDNDYYLEDNMYLQAFVDDANARLAPLVEALERLSKAHAVIVSDNPGGREPLRKAFDENDAAVTRLVGEYNKLREGK